MTKQRELGDLLVVTQALYDQRQHRFAKLLAAEQHLRNELSRLDDMARNAQTTNDEAHQMRAIGADLIWQGWIGRAKTALNMDLAKVLANKEHHLAEVRRAYGKVLVVRQMQDQVIREKKKERADKALTAAINMALGGTSGSRQ